MKWGWLAILTVTHSRRSTLPLLFYSVRTRADVVYHRRIHGTSTPKRSQRSKAAWYSFENLPHRNGGANHVESNAWHWQLFGDRKLILHRPLPPGNWLLSEIVSTSEGGLKTFEEQKRRGSVLGRNRLQASLSGLSPAARRTACDRKVRQDRRRPSGDPATQRAGAHPEGTRYRLNNFGAAPEP